MNTLKCPQCNLTNWATSISCKRCGQIFQEVENIAPPVPETQVSPPQLNNVASPTHNFAPQIYNEPQQFPQNNQQSNWNQPAYNGRNPYAHGGNFGEQKKKLAVISLITGILGFPFISMFVGAVLAVILGSLFGTAGIIFGFVLAISFVPTSLITGIIGWVKANKSPLEFGGKGLAIAGVVLSLVSFAFYPLIAAIAVPNLLAARRSANEGSAIATLRMLHGAEVTYMDTSGSGNCGELAQLVQKGLIDQITGSGTKSGYKFIMIRTPSGCELNATPEVINGFSASGIRSFHIDINDGIIYAAAKNGLLADKNDPPLISNDTPNYPPKIATR